MNADFRRMVVERNETALELAYFDDKCSHLFAVDWREDDADTCSSCAQALDLDSLTGEWRDDELYILVNGKELKAPLQRNEGDRHVTLCTLNEALHPDYEIRFLVFTHGSDTLGFAALAADDWRELEKANAEAVAENFIDPRKLPNLITELTDSKLPVDARARYERTLKRNAPAGGIWKALTSLWRR